MKNVTLNLSHETARALQDAILIGLPYLQSKIIRERIKPGVDALEQALRSNFTEAREKAKKAPKAEAKKPLAKKAPKVEKKPVVAKKSTKKKASPIKKKVQEKTPTKKMTKREVKRVIPDVVPMPEVAPIDPTVSEDQKAA